MNFLHKKVPLAAMNFNNKRTLHFEKGMTRFYKKLMNI